MNCGYELRSKHFRGFLVEGRIFSIKLYNLLPKCGEVEVDQLGRESGELIVEANTVGNNYSSANILILIDYKRVFFYPYQLSRGIYWGMAAGEKSASKGENGIKNG